MTGTPGIGDNSTPAARAALKSLMSQIIAGLREIDGIKTDEKVLYESAKDHGFNVKALRLAVKRKMETPTKREDREALDEVVETYLSLAGDADPVED